MKYKAVIFDMDGTIVDTERIWKQATQALIEKRGVTCTPDLQAELDLRTHGLTFEKSCIAIQEIAQLSDTPAQLAHEGRAIALSLYRKGITFIEGFKDFYQTVTTLQLNKAIATNADDDTIEITNKLLNLQDYFGRHIYGVSAVDFLCKPHPTIYLHAADKIGCKPEHCIAVEDSAFGVQAAKEAGLYCIGINTGGNRQALEKADVIVDRYDEINVKKLIS